MSAGAEHGSPPPPGARPVRLGPLTDEQLSERQREVVDDLVFGPTVNIYRSIVRHPEAAAAMVNLGRTLRAGGLPDREREILILRTGCNCASAYELAQHYRVGRSVGLSEGDMARIRLGPDAEGWDPFEAALCRAADELHLSHDLSDATWSELTARYDERQIIEATMVVGYYHLVSYVLNALGVPLEGGATPFPSA